MPRTEQEQYVLDTSGLAPIAASHFAEEDSFAAEYRRYAEIVVNEFLRKGIEEGEKEDGRNPFAAAAAFGEASSPENMVFAINKLFKAMNARISDHMTEYLIDHHGRVKQWALPNLGSTLSFERSNFEFEYDYFAGEYTVENGKITRAPGHTYKNHYWYFERDPHRLAKDLDAEFYAEHNNSFFVKLKEKDVQHARSELNSAKKKDEEITGAKASLILVAILAVLAGIATLRGLGLPVDVLPVANACTGFFFKMWNTLPVVLNFIVCVLLAIPLWLFVVALTVAQTAGTIILDISELGSMWPIGCIVVLWGAIFVAAALMGTYRIFQKSPLPAAQKAYEEAEAALKEKKAEYTRMEEEFHATGQYKQAQEQDRIETQADREKKAAYEAFAESWQRAWLEAVQQYDSATSSRRL